MLTKHLGRLSFSVILSLVLYSALSGEVDQLFYTLQLTGLNIPMTPFTYDMGYMLDRVENKEAYYKRTFVIEYTNEFTTANLEIGPLGFYEFKAPFQWVFECQANHNPCPMVHHYLCQSLNHYTQSQVKSWKMKEMNLNYADEQSGIGVNFICQK